MLGAENEEHGLRQVDWEPQHKSRVAEIGNRVCRATDKANGQYYLDFSVDDRYLLNTDKPVRVTVDYFDEGDGYFTLKYDFNDAGAPNHGRSKFAERVARHDTKTWKAHVFRLPDARFANNAIGGSDFFLASEAYGGGRRDAYVSSVSVIVGGMRVSVDPPAAPADGETACEVSALVMGPLGPVADGTGVSLAADVGTIEPTARTREGRATAPFVGPKRPGEATLTVSVGDDSHRGGAATNTARKDAKPQREGPD